MPTFRFTINGQERVINAVPDMPLLWVLRDLLQLTGTKYGCGAGVRSLYCSGGPSRGAILPDPSLSGERQQLHHH